MSNPLSIQGGQPFGGSHKASPSIPVTPNPVAAQPKPVPLYVNPSYQFDPTVGLVILEFHNAAGSISNSIPSQRQLELYRTHQAIPPNEQPPPAQPARSPLTRSTTQTPSVAPTSAAISLISGADAAATPPSTSRRPQTLLTVNGTTAAG